jgi:hypothetical protein
MAFVLCHSLYWAFTCCCPLKQTCKARCRWLISIILATQEAEIRRIVVRSQPGQIVCETLSRKKLSRKRAGGVAQGVNPEFKPQYCKKPKTKPVRQTEMFTLSFFYNEKIGAEHGGAHL